MFVQFVLGTILVALTVLVHAVFLDRLVVLLDIYSPYIRRHFYKYWKIILITITVLGVYTANICQIWIWAVVFYFLEAEGMHDFETALYLSTSAFTTVGFGDVHLLKDWRLLSSFESANGMILFGWSAAFIFDAVSKIYCEDDFIHPKKK